MAQEILFHLNLGMKENLKMINLREWEFFFKMAVNFRELIKMVN